MMISISEVIFIENTYYVCERDIRVEEHRDAKMSGKVASQNRRNQIVNAYHYLGGFLP